MSRIKWDSIHERFYQAGVSHGVYFNEVGEGSVWNGLISVVESESNNEASPIFIDGIKLVNRRRFGEFTASLEAIAAPDAEIALLKSMFSFSYKVFYGHYYEIHLVYNARAVVTKRTYISNDTNTSLTLLSLTISTLPQAIDANRRTSHLVVSSYSTHENTLQALENIIYGTDILDSRLPAPDEVLELFENDTFLTVTDLGDGVWEITGPDDAVYLNDDGSWTIDWPSVIQVEEHAYQISSL